MAWPPIDSVLYQAYLNIYYLVSYENKSKKILFSLYTSIWSIKSLVQLTSRKQNVCENISEICMACRRIKTLINQIEIYHKYFFKRPCHIWFSSIIGLWSVACPTHVYFRSVCLGLAIGIMSPMLFIQFDWWYFSRAVGNWSTKTPLLPYGGSIKYLFNTSQNGPIHISTMHRG